VKYELNVPPMGSGADPRLLADFAREAEDAGWDGFFIWDHIALSWPDALADVTVALTAIALATEKIDFGALVTPLARRRPAKFARETASLDQLSGGRLIVGVGLGEFAPEFEHLGEEGDPRTRAAMLDEALAVVTGLWSGDDVTTPFNHRGEHYTAVDANFWPKPVQQPRIPIWVAGMWPNKAPFRRAACWDGVVPGAASGDMRVLTPGEVREIVACVNAHRPDPAAPFVFVAYGSTPGDDPAEAGRDLLAGGAVSQPVRLAVGAGPLAARRDARTHPAGSTDGVAGRLSVYQLVESPDRGLCARSGGCMRNAQRTLSNEVANASTGSSLCELHEWGRGMKR
jgi:alkanesulfonate monooxygenase SsuD/methylene tetrahydromethanopterin reductase-like flavin-dependent oxidoreductase (luciferase family)